MPLILGTNSIKDTGYNVANSLRFNDGSSDSLTKTPSGAGNRRTWTFSTWVKRGVQGTFQSIMGADAAAQSSGFALFLSFDGTANDVLAFGQGSDVWLVTTQVFRDPSAWYHIVVAVDTTQGTANNRVRMYINGSEVTTFNTRNNPSQNYEMVWNNTVAHSIGADVPNSGLRNFFDGYMCETVNIDGQQLAADQFGEFDSDSPTIWKPIDVSGLTFGTNGFYLDFENSGSLGADVSGNGNNFTVNNLTAADQSIDTCTNNWSNLNAIDNINSVLSEGNLRTTGTSNWSKVNSTFSMPNGSWYVEIYSKVGSGNGNSGIGIKRVESPTAATLLGYESTSYGYLSNGNIYNNNGIITGSLATWSAGDIMSMSFTGSVLKFYKNNSLIHTISSLTGEYMFSFGSYPSDSYIVNFGQDGTFSGEVTAQGNSDPNGYGNFYYSPGSFYALNTKNLAEFG